MHLEIAEVLRDQVQLPVVRRKDNDLTERADRRDEPSRIGVRVGAEERFRVARTESERAWTVIDRENPDARASERADRREPVDPTHVDDCSRKTHRADSADVTSEAVDEAEAKA
jgi:hypothetical protein